MNCVMIHVHVQNIADLSACNSLMLLGVAVPGIEDPPTALAPERIMRTRKRAWCLKIPFSAKTKDRINPIS